MSNKRQSMILIILYSKSSLFRVSDYHIQLDDNDHKVRYGIREPVIKFILSIPLRIKLPRPLKVTLYLILHVQASSAALPDPI